MLTFYGKTTCVTCRKAKAFLDENGIAYEERPIESQPPARALLEQLIDPADVKASLNARSTLYKAKNLGQAAPDQKTVLDLMQQDPNLIKRPVIVTDQGRLYQGFDPATLKAFLAQS